MSPFWKRQSWRWWGWNNDENHKIHNHNKDGEDDGVDGDDEDGGSCMLANKLGNYPRNRPLITPIIPQPVGHIIRYNEDNIIVKQWRWKFDQVFILIINNRDNAFDYYLYEDNDDHDNHNDLKGKFAFMLFWADHIYLGSFFSNLIFLSKNWFWTLFFRSFLRTFYWAFLALFRAPKRELFPF